MKLAAAHDELMTLGQMARAMGRSEPGVRKAVRRLKIEPAAAAGKLKFYRGSETLEKLAVKMRALKQTD